MYFLRYWNVVLVSASNKQYQILLYNHLPEPSFFINRIPQTYWIGYSGN